MQHSRSQGNSVSKTGRLIAINYSLRHVVTLVCKILYSNQLQELHDYIKKLIPLYCLEFIKINEFSVTGLKRQAYLLLIIV